MPTKHYYVTMTPITPSQTELRERLVFRTESFGESKDIYNNAKYSKKYKHIRKASSRPHYSLDFYVTTYGSKETHPELYKVLDY